MNSDNDNDNPLWVRLFKFGTSSLLFHFITSLSIDLLTKGQVFPTLLAGGLIDMELDMGSYIDSNEEVTYNLIVIVKAKNMDLASDILNKINKKFYPNKLAEWRLEESFKNIDIWLDRIQKVYDDTFTS